ncbi:MAG TPA: putative Ig domain-containing protein [Burkholderiaceae bacterium]|nr:putative Ig domain-containing protein [Burkholderiaceae bacterium]
MIFKNRFVIGSIALALSVALLGGCGGGSDDPCGEKMQFFAIAFAAEKHSLKLGKPATIASTVTPESCRGDMSFAVRSGALPPGMTIENGNVTGTPTQSGEFNFQIYISGVEGYQTGGFSSFTAPRSGIVQVTVLP